MTQTQQGDDEPQGGTMTTPTFQHFGTVSHGTLRDEDLLPIFLAVVEFYDPNTATTLRSQYADVLEHLSTGLEPDADDLGNLRETLYDMLDGLAPEGYTFGAHEGDGSDFGFWSVDGETVDVEPLLCDVSVTDHWNKEGGQVWYGADCTLHGDLLNGDWFDRATIDKAVEAHLTQTQQGDSVTSH